MDSLDSYREIKGVTENAIEEGMNIKSIEIAKKMIMENEPIERIQRYTDLDKEAIKNLMKELKQSK